MRRVISGLARNFDPSETNGRDVEPADARREAGLPDIDLVLETLPSDISVSILRMAVHEAGHAAVAMRCGLTLDAIERLGKRTADGGTVEEFSCNLSGQGPYDDVSVTAAGLVSEILVWGHDVYWVGAAFDLAELARREKEERLGAIGRGVARALRTTGLPIPQSLDTSLALDDLYAARDRIPDKAILAAVEAFPETLRLAAFVARRWEDGDAFIAGEDAVSAMEEPRHFRP